jgi:hypothetical protein
MPTLLAASYLGVSESAFRTHVAPSLTPVHVGAKPLYPKEELDAWVDHAKGSGSSGNLAPMSSPSLGRKVQRGLATKSSEAQGIVTLAERRRRGRQSTRQPLGDRPQNGHGQVAALVTTLKGYVSNG